MSKPDIQQTIGGYIFLWPEGIEIKVSRLKVHNSDGRVSGEILIKNEKATLYPQTQVNFSADRTRNILAKSLTDRYEGHDWQQIIDQLSYHVQEKAREGEPVLELWTSEELKPPEYIIDPFIMKNQANVLFGAPESGKSQFAMLLSLITMLPWSENPLGLKVCDQSTRVLWLDYEADEFTTQYNFTRLSRGIEQGDMALMYRRCRMTLADDIEAVSNHLDKVGASLIVIDSLGKAAGNELLGSESANRFYAALDQLKCTSLILAHTSKGEADRKSIYGSVFFEAYARSVWEMRASRDGDEMTIGLWDNKANFRRKHDPMAFQLYYERERIVITTQDIKTVEDFFAHLSLAARITASLETGSKTVSELKDDFEDVKPANIYAELARLTKKKKLVRMGSGKDVSYGIPFKGDPI